MRNLFSSKYMYLTAAMLTGAAMFTSCSNEDDMGNVNPTYDGESVKTQFAINIPAAGKADTRLGQDIVQGQDDPLFRGMDNLRLIPFRTATPDQGLTAGTSIASDAIILDPILSGTGAENNLENGAKFYSDVTVPVSTNRFLFYAEATRAGGSDDRTNGALEVPDRLSDGNLNGNVATLDGIDFKLKNINATSNQQIEAYLVKILNDVTTALSGKGLDTHLNNLKGNKAGSSKAILALMQQLYDVVKADGGTDPQTDVETAILNYFADGGNGVLSYRTDGSYVADADNYPANLELPEGAAQVVWNSTAFEYVHTNASAFDTYVYPASLYYFVDTDLLVSDASQSAKWDGSNWNSFVTTNYTGGNTVTAGTQSIVLKEAINYAVAQMVYTVQFTDIQIPDNRGVNRQVGTNNFQLKGILIGGQKPVDFKFEQKDGDVRTIYDFAETATSITNAKSTNFYTLALQTEKRTTQTGDGNQKVVNFALEFLNNGEDFYGVDGIVPQGGTFYLTGQLKTKETEAEPNYVFERDHKTVATITINSLKNARYTVPDLRKTELELGLYVDLEWQDGLTQDVVIQ